MSMPPTHSEARRVRTAGGLLRRLRLWFAPTPKVESAEFGHKLPPIAEIVAKTGRDGGNGA